MIELLKIEWLKIRRYRAFLVLTSFFVLSVFGINYIVYVTIGNVMDMTMAAGGDSSGVPDVGEIVLGRPFGFPSVWQTVTYLSSYLLFIPGLLIIMLTANEFTYKTHRQAVIDGQSRMQFIGAKIGLVFVAGIVITLLAGVMAWLFGLDGPASFSMRGVGYLGYFFLQAITYMSVALVLALFFRRSGVSIGIYFLYTFILKNLLALLINYKVYEGLGNFMPVKTADLLILAPTMIGKALNPFPAGTTQMLMATVAWIGLFLWLCVEKFRRIDL